MIQILYQWEKLGRRAVDPILTQQPVELLPTLWYVLWYPKAHMEMSGEHSSFWFKWVLVDSLTSYTFGTGEWKVIQMPPETFMPELNLQHMRANAIWKLRFSLSLQYFCDEENIEMVSATQTELHRVPLSLAATFFTLCCNVKREFALPSDVYLIFTCVHNSQEKMTYWENICFHKSQEAVAADSQTNTV